MTSTDEARARIKESRKTPGSFTPINCSLTHNTSRLAGKLYCNYWITRVIDTGKWNQLQLGRMCEESHSKQANGPVL